MNTGEKVASLFYCDPSCSWQKGSIEKNHEYIDIFFLRELLSPVLLKMTVI